MAVVHVLFPVVMIAVVGFVLELIPEVSGYLRSRCEAKRGDAE